MREAMSSCALDAGNMAAVAVHGTGTPLGDPIEVGALGVVLGGVTPTTPVLLIASKVRSASCLSELWQPQMSFKPAHDACACLTTMVITLHGSKQACYGHTEGAAGLAGAITAAALCCSALAPPLTTLRHLNPYMAAAASDWRARQGMQAEVPRQLASCHALVCLCI